MGITYQFDCLVCFFSYEHLRVSHGCMFGYGSVACMGYSITNKKPYMKALGKYMQPNQAILTMSRRMKSWMVSGLFAQ